MVFYPTLSKDLSLYCINHDRNFIDITYEQLQIIIIKIPVLMSPWGHMTLCKSLTG